MAKTFFIGTDSRYVKYLNSPEWKSKRQAVKERCKGICERCRKFLVDEVHHLSYAHIYNEMLEELQGLCKPCHRFLHGNSGIDPLVTSIHIKVAFKVIEYWDSKAKKHRRVSIDKLSQENFGWIRVCTQEGKTLRTSHTNVGCYHVPMDVFLDKDGTPIFNPAGWERFKVASWRRGWFYHNVSGRPVPPDPEIAKRRKVEQQRTTLSVEERKEREESRQKDSPECYTSYQGQVPKTDKEVMALFRRFPKIVEWGRDCQILSVRKTKTMGIVLDLQFDESSGWIRFKLYQAQHRLVLCHSLILG